MCLYIYTIIYIHIHIHTIHIYIWIVYIYIYIYRIHKPLTIPWMHNYIQVEYSQVPSNY